MLRKVLPDNRPLRTLQDKSEQSAFFRLLQAAYNFMLRGFHTHWRREKNRLRFLKILFHFYGNFKKILWIYFPCDNIAALKFYSSHNSATFRSIHAAYAFPDGFFSLLKKL